MKLIVDNLGKFLVAAVVCVLVFGALSAFFIPGVRDFASSIFIAEKNFVETKGGAKAPTITCTNQNVTVAVGGTVNLFADITAKSSHGANLISQLTSDYAKTVSERKQVFVYKVNDDFTNTLVSEIDTSTPGNWTVLYLVKDGAESAILEIKYRVV